MNFMQTLRTAFRGQTANRLETEYLNEAVSLLDLESRQRQIDRGQFRNRNYPF